MTGRVAVDIRLRLAVIMAPVRPVVAVVVMVMTPAADVDAAVRDDDRRLNGITAVHRHKRLGGVNRGRLK